MEQAIRGTWPTVPKTTIVLLAGVIVLLLLFPAGVLHSNAAAVSLLDIGNYVSDTRAAMVLTAWNVAAMSMGTWAFLSCDA